MVLLRVVIVLLLAFNSFVFAFRSINPTQEEIETLSTSSRRARALPKPPARRQALHYERETNAKRFAQGLPPLPPRSMRRATLTTEDLVPEAYNPKPSNKPNPTAFLIEVSNKKTGRFIGYVGRTFEVFGEYGPVTAAADALQVEVNGLHSGISGPLDIREINGDNTFTFVGGIVGFASDSAALKHGSFDYLYVGGTKRTPDFSTPDAINNAFTQATGINEDSESSIWVYDSDLNELTAEWINPDGNIAATDKIVLFEPDNVFVVVGDLDSFEAEFGSGGTVVTFSLVSA